MNFNIEENENLRSYCDLQFGRSECIGIQSKYLFSVERIRSPYIEESRIGDFFIFFYKKYLLFRNHDGILINVADAETQKMTKRN
ncbi:hypothetical protein CN569_24645 [Bacillus toyonensis]|nr:hypothetical protein CN569_24645 [Bacillus toyonensis]